MSRTLRVFGRTIEGADNNLCVGLHYIGRPKSLSVFMKIPIVLRDALGMTFKLTMKGTE